MTPEREKRAVALSSVAAAVLLTGMKAVVGISTGSLGILSEAAHSLLDLVAAIITLWAVQAASKPADPEHPYGHGKFENLSALAETLLLFVTSGWIFYESVKRLLFEDVHVEATAWAFAVMIVSIVVDVSRSRALKRVAEKHGSQALEADALHFSTDVWSSSVVMLGLGGVLLADRLGIRWLAKADAAAALVVALIVVWVTFRLGKRSVDDLVDAVPAELRDRVTQAAEVDGVLDVRKVRIRKSGAETFADVIVSVARDTSFERAHDIAVTARKSIQAAVPGSDVVIHTQPVATGEEGILVAVRLAALREGLGAHAIRLGGIGDIRTLELHLEVPESLTLAEAHERTVRFEAEVKKALPEVRKVVPSIEPVGESTASVATVEEDAAPVRRVLEELLEAWGLDPEPVNVNVQRVADGLSVSFQAGLDGTLSVSEARARAAQVERELKARLPAVRRVLVRLVPLTIGKTQPR